MRFLFLILLSFFAGQADANFYPEVIKDFGLVHTHTIALTFDDGPGDGTKRILDLLKKYKIKATFFMIGENYKDAPELVKRLVREGHILGNHTLHHPDLADPEFAKNPKHLLHEILKTHQILSPDFGISSKYLYFRAPYGHWQPNNAVVLNAVPLLRRYIGPIQWDAGNIITKDANGNFTESADWECWEDMHYSPEVCLKGYLAKIEELDGGVVLTHDSYKESADMWELLLPMLVERGFKFVTVEQIKALDPYRAETRKKSAGLAQ